MPLRRLLLVTALSCGLGVCAQGWAFHHVIHCASSISLEEAHQIGTAVLQQDENATVTWDLLSGDVYALTHTTIHLKVLYQDLAGAGPVIEDLSVSVLDQSPHPVGSERMDAPPHFVDTGDPAADHARYAEEKIKWLASHPRAVGPDVSDPDQ